mmetsp:Transcript_46568/g.98827  ORF Transcript_46568/g.98827 Transcript_46568/m.98827 type:complete len:462 (+) Transcript_46568:138-1523(+)
MSLPAAFHRRYIISTPGATPRRAREVSLNVRLDHPTTRSYPLARVLERVHYVRLGTPRLGMVVVLPPRRLREAHQYALDPPSRLEPEHGPAIVHEVELDVPSPPHLLPLLLPLREGIVLVGLDDGPVGRHDGVDGVLRELEELLGIAIVEVVEEDAPEASRLVAVADDEVPVGPRLELGIELGIVTVAHLLVRAVEVPHVVEVQVGGGDVRAAAEPPHAAVGLEVAVVEVHRRTVGVARVHHAREAAREEGHPLPRGHALGPVDAPLGGGLERLLGHGAVHDREVDAGLLEDLAVLEDAGHAAAAVGADPAVLLEGGAAVDVLDGGGDGNLGLADHLLEAGAHGVVAVGSVAGPDEGLGRLLHRLVRIPSDVHRGGVLPGLLPVRLAVGELRGQEGALEALLLEGGGGGPLEARRRRGTGDERPPDARGEALGGGHGRRKDEQRGGAEIHISSPISFLSFI